MIQNIIPTNRRRIRIIDINPVDNTHLIEHDLPTVSIVLTRSFFRILKTDASVFDLDCAESFQNLATVGITAQDSDPFWASTYGFL